MSIAIEESIADCRMQKEDLKKAIDKRVQGRDFCFGLLILLKDGDSALNYDDVCILHQGPPLVT